MPSRRLSDRLGAICEWHSTSALLDDELTWRPHLQDRLTDYFGQRRLDPEGQSRLCPYTSSFRLDELDVQFVDGSRVRLVLKDLGREGMIEEARRARPEFLLRAPA